MCLKACTSTDFSVAGIHDGTWCFCKSHMPSMLQKTDDAICKTMSCPGNSNLSCGSYGFIMIYMKSVKVLIALYPNFSIKFTNKLL